MDFGGAGKMDFRLKQYLKRFITCYLLFTFYSNVETKLPVYNGRVVEGQDTGSGVSKMETTAGVRQTDFIVQQLSLIHI